jgi:hypothetical protein
MPESPNSYISKARLLHLLECHAGQSDAAIDLTGLDGQDRFEPEDYPEAGYLFNNAARHGVSFKDYGALIRIEGTDTGGSTPTLLNDPLSGKAGYPTSPATNIGDVTTTTRGLGQSYFLALPMLSVLGGRNPNGEPRLDHHYPGYNFNISDQRRAREFMQDFDRMVAGGTLPAFIADRWQFRTGKRARP